MNRKEQRKMVVYLIVALAGGWLMQLLGIFIKNGMFYSLFLQICMFMPLLGVFAACHGLRYEKTGIYWKISFKRNIKWLLFALFMPAVFTSIGALLYFILFRNDFNASMPLFAAIMTQNGTTAMPAHLLFIPQLISAITFAPVINMVFALGEETGWRGFMTPMLKKQFGERKALLISGVIWAAFHYPLIILAGYEYGIGYAGAPFTGMLAMILFTLSFGMFLSYIYEKSESIWIPSLAHGAVNAIAGMPLYFMNAKTTSYLLGPHLPGVISVLPMLIFVIICMRSNKSKKQKPSNT